MQPDHRTHVRIAVSWMQKAALLEVLQLRSKHADASLQLAQIRKVLAGSGPASKSGAEFCRSVQRAPHTF
jgi:hypothetical protein